MGSFLCARDVLQALPLLKFSREPHGVLLVVHAAERPLTRSLMEDCASKAGPIALVLSGGVGLGAYRAGAYAAVQDRGLTPQWLAGSSAGAVNAALIAGTRPENRVSALRTFWMGEDALFTEAFAPFAATRGWRHLQNWMKAIEARLFGARGHFRPRFLTHPFERLAALYDLAPMRQRIERLVDFDRLNGGDIRMAVATTEVDTGEMVIFDTGQGARIGVDHLLASCGFLPEFPTVEIEGRLLGDGGLSGNAPVEAIAHATDQPLTMFVIDLYPREAPGRQISDQPFHVRPTFSSQTKPICGLMPTGVSCCCGRKSRASHTRAS
jgi:NTE family protein